MTVRFDILDTDDPAHVVVDERRYEPANAVQQPSGSAPSEVRSVSQRCALADNVLPVVPNALGTGRASPDASSID